MQIISFLFFPIKQNLLKYTSADQREYKQLEKAITYMKEIAQQLNEKRPVPPKKGPLQNIIFNKITKNFPIVNNLADRVFRIFRKKIRAESVSDSRSWIYMAWSHPVILNKKRNK